MREFVLKHSINKDGTGRDVQQKRVLILGASGTIGQATTRALIQSGYEVTCLLRPGGMNNDSSKLAALQQQFDGATIRFAQATDIVSLMDDGFLGDKFDVLISCIASRNGSPKTSWEVDYQANLNALELAKTSGVEQFILLSAICVQKPLLEFQFAKLAFENALIESGIKYSIVRPTAFFKSLSGQIKRLKQGKPYLMFGNGELTSCKPISDGDLAEYLTSCIHNTAAQNCILPIGGPGPAVSPREQGECLFELLGKAPKFKQVPVRLLDSAIWTLSNAGRILPKLSEKADFARIAKYYATESMLVLNQATGLYDSDLTPSTGEETLFEHYAKVVSGEAIADLGEHSMF